MSTQYNGDVMLQYCTGGNGDTVCLVIAYPVAYILAGSALKRKGVILMLFVLPMWINFTLRITALKEILL